MDVEKVAEECKKCAESPYYFMTNYVIVDGKPFTTLLQEKEFNEYIVYLQSKINKK